MTLPAPGSSSERKRAAVLAAARADFLKHGFAGVTMDEIATEAQVSKQTVYAQFGDKAGLFTAVCEAAIAEAEGTGQEHLDRLVEAEDRDDVEDELLTFAQDHLATVLQPHLVQMRRMVIAESLRFPQLARRWHEAAPVRGHRLIGAAIGRLHDRGLLDAPDPVLAAQHLNHLILAGPLDQAMFTERPPFRDRRARRRWVEEAVRVFLAAYAPRAGADAADGAAVEA